MPGGSSIASFVELADGVLPVPDTSAPPGSNPVAGSLLYSNGQDLFYRGKNGVVPLGPNFYPNLVRGATTDNTAAIRGAIAVAAASGRGTVEIPDGDWYCLISDASYINATDNVTVRLSPGARIIIRADSGNYTTVFGAGNLTNFHIVGGTIDQNAANATGRVQAGVAGTPQFVLYVTGTATNVTCDYVTFDSYTGVNTVWLAGTGSDTVGCRFCKGRYQKTAATTKIDDNSFAYLGGKNQIFIGNEVDGNYADVPGGACEMHGAPGVCMGNTVRKYNVGLWIAAPFSSADQDINSTITVSGNVFDAVACGIRILCVTSASNANPFIRNVTISGNAISILQGATHHDAAIAMGFGIDVGSPACVVQGVRIGPHTVTFETGDTRTTSTRWGTSVTGPSAGVGVNMALVSGGVHNVTLDGVTVRDAPGPAFVIGSVSANSVLDTVKLRQCVAIDAGRNPNANTRAGLVLSGILNDGEFDVEVQDTSATGTPNGQYAWQLFPAAVTVRSRVRLKKRLSGSGALSQYWDVNSETLLGTTPEGSETFTGSFTADPLAGGTKYVNAAGPITITAPRNDMPQFSAVFLKDQKLRIVFKQDATGSRALTFSSATGVWRQSFTPDPTAGKTSSVDFESDGVHLIQVSQQATGV